jgi:hypothetical protein
MADKPVRSGFSSYSDAQSSRLWIAYTLRQAFPQRVSHAEIIGLHAGLAQCARDPYSRAQPQIGQHTSIRDAPVFTTPLTGFAPGLSRATKAPAVVLRTCIHPLDALGAGCGGARLTLEPKTSTP